MGDLIWGIRLLYLESLYGSHDDHDAHKGQLVVSSTQLVISNEVYAMLILKMFLSEVKVDS